MATAMATGNAALTMAAANGERRQHQHAAGNPKRGERHQRPAGRRRHAGPVAYGRQQESGHDGDRVAVQHFVAVPRRAAHDTRREDVPCIGRSTAGSTTRRRRWRAGRTAGSPGSTARTRREAGLHSAARHSNSTGRPARSKGMNDPCDPALMASTMRCSGASASWLVGARPSRPARPATKTIAHSGPAARDSSTSAENVIQLVGRLVHAHQWRQRTAPAFRKARSLLGRAVVGQFRAREHEQQALRFGLLPRGAQQIVEAGNRRVGHGVVIAPAACRRRRDPRPPPPPRRPAAAGIGAAR